MSVGMDRPIARAWWRRRSVIISAVVVGAIALGGLGALALRGASARTLRVSASTVTIDTVSQAVFHDFTPLQGKVTPKDTLYLDALEGGQVQEILAQAGDRVTKGQALVRFRNSQVERDVLQGEAQAAQGLTQTQTYETTLEVNHANNERTLDQIDYDIVRLRRALDRRSGYEAGVFSQEQIDQFKDELDLNLKQRPVQAATNKTQDELRRAQLPGIREAISRLEESMTKARDRLEDLVVKAPAAGRLTVFDLKLGQAAKQGDRLAELVPDTGFKIAADVDEYYLPRVQTGQTAVASFDGRDVRLKAIRVYPQVKNGTFTVDLAFVDKEPANLTTGAAVQGRLSLGNDQPALVLPAGAFLERSGGDYVFVLGKDGHSADRRRIKIGRRNTEQVEVLSGLQPGDRVITSDYEGYEKLDRIQLK
jgi:HlyD family secretion protein